jgi:hypothetical protein
VNQGAFVEARRFTEKALTMFRIKDDKRNAALCLVGLGHTAWMEGDLSEATTLSEQAVELARANRRP